MAPFYGWPSTATTNNVAYDIWTTNTAGNWYQAWQDVATPVLSPGAIARLNLARLRHTAIAEPPRGRDRAERRTTTCRRVTVHRGHVGWIRAGTRRPLKRRRRLLA